VEGVLVNRVRLWPDGEAVPETIASAAIETAELDALADALGQAPGAGDPRAAARTAVELAKRYASLVRQDERSAAPLREQAQRHGQLFGQIPELPRDVCDLDGLVRIGDVLFRGAKLPESRPEDDAARSEADA